MHPMASRLQVLLCATLIAGLPAVAVGDQEAAQRQELVDQATKAWSGVHRWLIEYEATPSATTPGVSAHRVMAVASPGSFYHLSAHFTPQQPWQVDPFCQEYFIAEGLTCHRWPFNRTYSEGRMKPGDDLGGTIEYDLLLLIAPTWPLTEYQTPRSSEFGTLLLPSAAIRSADYRLLPQAESFAGESCAVFEREGVERIWLATQKGTCVVRRDMWNPHSGRLAQRISAEKVEQIAPGLWLPMEVRSQFFAQKREGNEETVEREYQLRILRCQRNEEVPLSLFTPVHRPGSVKFDTASQSHQVLAGGEDLLTDVVDFMTKYADLPTKPARGDHPAWWFLGGLGGGLCGGLILFDLLRGIGRRKNA